MKKTFYYLGLMLLSICLNLAVTSCSSDDDGTEEITTTSKIAGKWFYESSDVYTESEFIDKEDLQSFVSWMVFTEYGDISWYDTDLQEIIYGAYRLDGSTLYVYNIEHEDYLPYSYTVKQLTDKKMTLGVELEGLYKMDVHYTKEIK